MATKSYYIDRTGQAVLDVSHYESAGNFSEGLAPVSVQHNGWGFIDKTGALVIAPRYESALSFTDGLAAVVIDDRWGFIDKTGALVIPNQFAWVAEFSEGVAVVQRSLELPKPKPKNPAPSSQWSIIVETFDLLNYQDDADQRDDGEFLLIDRTGKTLVGFDNAKVSPHLDDAMFSEGLLCAFSPEQDAMGYIDKSGKFVIQPKFAEVGPFSEGLARVAVRDDDNEKLGFINKAGEFVIAPTFNTDFDFRRNGTGFSEGLAALSEGLNPTQTKESTFVYLDKAGEIALTTNFFYAGEFRGGLAVVYDADRNQWGFIDKTGEVVIPVQYEIANDFSAGLALVSISA